MQERLLEIGRWLAVNGEAIYGSRANPFWPRRFAWGACTQKPGRLFLHVHDSQHKAIDLRGIHSTVTKAYMLADKARRPLRIAPLADGIHIDLPQPLPDSAVSVVALEIQGPLSVDKTPQQEDDGSVYLHCFAMKVQGTKAKVVFEGASRVLHVGGWSDRAEKVHVDFDLHEPSPLEVLATYSSDAAAAGSRFVVSVGEQQLLGVTENTGDWGKYKTLSLGQITLAKTGRYTLWVSLAAEGSWKGMGLQSVTLRRKRQ